MVVLLACDNTLLLCLPGSNHFTSSEVECPSTWVKFGQSCYSFDPVVYQLTFEKSREHCRLTGEQPGLYKYKFRAFLKFATMEITTAINIFSSDFLESSALLSTQTFSLKSFYFAVNNSDVLTVVSDKENRFVLEQLWTLGLLHQTVWLGMYFNQDSKNLITVLLSNRCFPDSFDSFSVN